MVMKTVKRRIRALSHPHLFARAECIDNQKPLILRYVNFSVFNMVRVNGFRLEGVGIAVCTRCTNLLFSLQYTALLFNRESPYQGMIVPN